MDKQTDEFERAVSKAAAERAALRYAVEARVADGRLHVVLANRAEVAVPLGLIQGLSKAAAADLSEVEISPAGTGIHFPRLDADVYVPALLEGVFGSKAWMEKLGAKGGRSKSEAKSEAARRNGAKGGRPRTRALVSA